MSELLKPFTHFLERIGINPLIFVLILLLILIFLSRDNYLNWEKQSKNQKHVLIWYILGLLMVIFSWFIIEFMSD